MNGNCTRNVPKLHFTTCNQGIFRWQPRKRKQGRKELRTPKALKPSTHSSWAVLAQLRYRRYKEDSLATARLTRAYNKCHKFGFSLLGAWQAEWLSATESKSVFVSITSSVVKGEGRQGTAGGSCATICFLPSSLCWSEHSLLGLLLEKRRVKGTTSYYRNSQNYWE